MDYRDHSGEPPRWPQYPPFQVYTASPSYPRVLHLWSQLPSGHIAPERWRAILWTRFEHLQILEWGGGPGTSPPSGYSGLTALTLSVVPSRHEVGWCMYTVGCFGGDGVWPPRLGHKGHSGSSWATPEFLTHRDSEMIDVCFKALSLGIRCHRVTDYWHSKGGSRGTGGCLGDAGHPEFWATW